MRPWCLCILKLTKSSNSPRMYNRMDILDDPGSMTIVASLELLGLGKQDISLMINGDSLVVWGERCVKRLKRYLVVQEVKYRKFRCVIPLPKGVQVMSIIIHLTCIPSTNCRVVTYPHRSCMACSQSNGPDFHGRTLSHHSRQLLAMLCRLNPR